MNIFIILFAVLIAIVSIFIITIYVYNNYLQFGYAPFSKVKKWKTGDTSFNKRNYVNSINLINYIYDIYNISLQKSLSLPNFKKEIMTDFFIKNPSFIFTNVYISKGIKNPLFNQETYTIEGVIGKIHGTRTGIICFRGTKNFTEWIADSQSMGLSSLDTKEPFTGDEKIKETPYFVGMTPPKTPDIKIGYGWYEIFNVISGMKTNHNCICSNECLNSRCKIIPVRNLSKIDGLTNCSSFFSCGLGTDCDNCGNLKGSNVSSQIIDYVTSNTDIDNYIITGHSLGGVLATLTAWNIGPEKVHSIYTFASPKVGNEDFKKNFDSKFENKMFRIENTNDPFPKLPNGNDFKAVGNDNYVFTATYENKPKNNPYYHDLYNDYLKSFDKIKKNLKKLEN